METRQIVFLVVVVGIIVFMVYRVLTDKKKPMTTKKAETNSKGPV